MVRLAPDWDHLYARAETQAGHVTTAQAAQAGYSPQLLQKHLANGRLVRVRRGVYRLVHFPQTEDEELVVHWLWSGGEGVFSHETALSRHQLSELLPHEVEMVVPAHWAARRLRVPDGLRLHFADLGPEDRTWHGPVPITTPARSVNDAAAAGVAPEQVELAILEGLARGLFVEEEVREARDLLAAWGAP